MLAMEHYLPILYFVFMICLEVLQGENPDQILTTSECVSAVHKLTMINSRSQSRTASTVKSGNNRDDSVPLYTIQEYLKMMFLYVKNNI